MGGAGGGVRSETEVGAPATQVGNTREPPTYRKGVVAVEELLHELVELPAALTLLLPVDGFVFEDAADGRRLELVNEVAALRHELGEQLVRLRPGVGNELADVVLGHDELLVGQHLRGNELELTHGNAEAEVIVGALDKVR